MIPKETVQLILDTAQIADVVGDYLTLKRRGASLVACCPFHHEKTPSFYVTPAKGIYKCFGCSKSGTAVGFVMEMEHCTYIEALRLLAKKYHIEVVEKEESAEDIAQRQRSESLMIVTEFAQKFFKENLNTSEGRNIALQYYQSRGILPETIEKFGLGWAPSVKDALTQKALNSGYKAEYLLGAGLSVQRDDGSLIDKFRERIMFPIHSVSGRVIAYSGRTLRSDNPAKYVNSPETEIYIKSRNLLGIYFAKAEISRQNRCILVEGNVDMVMMHQLGITNVVASCGTSLTIEQIRLIHKFTENITIMYDGDSAGIHAAIRGIDMILAEGMNVAIVMLPEGEDPDSYSRKHSLEEVRTYIESNETDFITFKSGLLLDQAKGDPLKKAQLINDIADTIAQIPDAVKRSTYIEHTANQFAIESSILFERIRKTRLKLVEESRKSQQRAEDLPAVETPSPAPIENIQFPLLYKSEEELIYFLLTHGCDLMVFPTDSPFYSENPDESFTVADLIRESLEEDGSEIANSQFAEIYSSYFALYDEGLEQQEIIKRLLDSPNRMLAAKVADLSEEKYKITIEKLKSSLTSIDTWLAVQVPKAILVYGESKLKIRLQDCMQKLKTASEDEETYLMKELMEIQKLQKILNDKIGRNKNYGK